MLALAALAAPAAAATAHPATSAGPGPIASVAPADTTIELRTEGSNLEFTPARISVKQGTRVTLRYTNAGTLPHNLVLVRDEADLDALASAAYEAQATGFVPLDQKDRMIAHTPLVSPGQTVEVTFVAPPPGEYTYICLFPGHANMMLGTLRSLR